jgi:hypothetical protein
VAADASTDFAFLAAAARRSIEDLRRSASLAHPGAGRRGTSFLTVVKSTLDAIDQGVAMRESEFAAATDETEQRSLIRAMQLINIQVMSLHQTVPWMESTHGSDLALGLTYFVDEIGRALLRQSADVVMTPSAQYMYSTNHKPFLPALTALGVRYPCSVPDVIVAYPSQERDSLFLHLVIAHELGHSAIAEHRLDRQVLLRDPDPTATGAILNQAVQEHAAVEGSAPAAARALVRQMLRNWLDELICDGLALGYLGPSFLFTFAAFMTPFGGPVPSGSHPPHTLRTRFLLERIDSWGWRELFETEVPSTFSWIESSGRGAQEAGHQTYYLRLEEAIAGLSQALEAVVGDHLGGERFELESHREAISDLRGLLQYEILPSQLRDGAAADRRSIVLSGWLREFEKYGDTPVALVEIIADRDHQRFLTKALEMSTVLQRWRAL